jgi:hypothetical protein
VVGTDAYAWKLSPAVQVSTWAWSWDAAGATAAAGLVPERTPASTTLASMVVTAANAADGRVNRPCPSLVSRRLRLETMGMSGIPSASRPTDDMARQTSPAR